MTAISPAASQRLLPALDWLRRYDVSNLRPDLVAEVAYDAMEGDRFRHTAQFVRWRPDRQPRSCRYDQLDETPPALLADLFAS